MSPRKTMGPPMLVTVGATPENADPSTPTTQATDTLDRLGDEGERKVSARIFRLDPMQNREAFLESVEPSLIDEPWIRETYGGGRYFVRFWGPMANGKFGYLKQQTREFTIDSSIVFKGALKERNLSAGLSGPVKNPGDEEDDADMKMLFKSQLLNLIKEQSETRNTSSTMLMNMMSQQAQAQQQFMALVLQLFSANKAGGGLGEMKEILGPLIAGAVNRKDPTEIAASLVNLMKPNTEMRDIFGMIREMKETSELFGGVRRDGGDDDSSGPIWRILEKAVPGALDILKAESAKMGVPLRQLASAPGRPALPAAAVRPVPPSPPPASAPAAPAVGADASAAPLTETAPVDSWTPLEPYIAYLVAFASDNKEPFDVVHTVKLMAPAAMLANIRELVAKDDALDIMLARFPQLQPHRAWTAQLLDEFYNDIFGEDEDDPAGGDDPAAGPDPELPGLEPLTEEQN